VYLETATTACGTLASRRDLRGVVRSTACRAIHQFDISTNALVLKAVQSSKRIVWCAVDSTYYNYAFVRLILNLIFYIRTLIERRTYAIHPKTTVRPEHYSKQYYCIRMSFQKKNNQFVCSATNRLLYQIFIKSLFQSSRVLTKWTVTQHFSSIFSTLPTSP
jgi:hypothetical protein